VSEWQSDIDSILARRNDNGADFWATPDGRIYVGNPYSTIASLCMLHELGVGRGITRPSPVASRRSWGARGGAAASRTEGTHILRERGAVVSRDRTVSRDRAQPIRVTRRNHGAPYAA
jgi:hypothetical protein